MRRSVRSARSRPVSCTRAERAPPRPLAPQGTTRAFPAYQCAVDHDRLRRAPLSPVRRPRCRHGLWLSRLADRQPHQLPRRKRPVGPIPCHRRPAAPRGAVAGPDFHRAARRRPRRAWPAHPGADHHRPGAVAALALRCQGQSRQQGRPGAAAGQGDHREGEEPAAVPERPGVQKRSLPPTAASCSAPSPRVGPMSAPPGKT